MDIRQLKYFIEIANAKTLSQASKNLFVSQPTLSLALKKMENELNTKLFYSDNKSYGLTDSGQKLYDRGLAIVEEFDSLINEIQLDSQKNEQTTIRVGLTILFAVQFMNQMSQFIVNNSNITLSIIQGGSPKLQSMLAKDELDVALVSFPNMESSQISIEPLTDSGYNVSVVVPESHALSKYEELTFDDLKHQRFSSLTDEFILGRLLIEQAKAHQFDPEIVFSHTDLQVLLYSLKKFDSVCLLPTEYKPIGEINGVRWIPLNNSKSYFPIGIALNKVKKKTSYIDLFIEEIKKQSF